MRWALWFLVACKSVSPTDTDTDTDTPSPSETGDTAATHTGDTGPVGPPPVDCSVLPPVPLDYTTLTGFTFSEDFDFDNDGYHVSVTVTGNLRAKNLAGDTRLISPNVGAGAACTRMLPNGDFVVCNVGANSLVRVDATTGAKTTLISGLSYPNGGEVDPEGFVYVSEQNAGRVRRVNSDTGESTVIATGLNNPNGVIFDPTWSILYVVSFGGGVVYALDRTGPDSFAPARVLVQHPGLDIGFDGVNIDECGNVYVTQYIQGLVWRVTPDGVADLAVNLPSSWIPNMRWGTGEHGWSDDVLYVSDRDQGRLFALDVGFKGKPHFPPPTP